MYKYAYICCDLSINDDNAINFLKYHQIPIKIYILKKKKS